MTELGAGGTGLLEVLGIDFPCNADNQHDLMVAGCRAIQLRLPELFPEYAEPLASWPPPVDIDDRIIRRAQHGDAWALDELVRSLQPYLGRICGAIALDNGDDALQNTLVAVVRHLGSLREPAALRGWARRIAVRESLRATGHGRNVPIDPASLDATLPSIRDDATAVEVRAVLGQLAPAERAVLTLRYLDGVGQAEMAQLLNVAPGTVKSRLSRARAAFKARWTA